MTRPRRLHHIHRIDDSPKRDHAWIAQVQVRGKVTIRRFSDGRHGGKQRALKAALRFRDTLLRGTRDPDYWFWRRHRKRRNNTSGIVGVGRYASRDHGATERVSWQAFWDGADGRRHSRKFSVEHHGERRARELAIRVRKDAMRAIFR